MAARNSADAWVWAGVTDGKNRTRGRSTSLIGSNKTGAMASATNTDLGARKKVERGVNPGLGTLKKKIEGRVASTSNKGKTKGKESDLQGNNKRKRIGDDASYLREKKRVRELVAWRDWSALTMDIMGSILRRLTLLSDYDRFGSVCRSWRRAALDPWNRSSRIEYKISPTMPLLLLPSCRPGANEVLDKWNSSSGQRIFEYFFFPEKIPEWRRNESSDSWTRSLYDPFQKKLLLQEFKLPVLKSPSGKFYGSSHGWLVYGGLHESDLHLVLVNPFYFGGGSHTHGGIICLPPLRHCAWSCRSCKIVLSADPALFPKDYVVSVIGSEKSARPTRFNYDNEFAVIKSGDKTWTCWGIEGRLQDVIFRGYAIWVVADFGCIYSLNIMDPEPEIRQVVADPHTALRDKANQYYIVESPDNDLLLVYRSKKNKFRVFQLVVQDIWPGQAWEEINKLANTVIYVGRSHSTCIPISPSSDLPGFQSGSIYFDDDCLLEDCVSHTASYEGTGLFSLHNKTIHQCYHLGCVSLDLDIPPPIWFHPSLPAGLGGDRTAGPDDCYKCGRPGHWARDCPLAGRGGGSRDGGDFSSRPRYGAPIGRGSRFGGERDRYIDDRYDVGRYDDRDRYDTRDRYGSRDRYVPDRYPVGGERYAAPDRYGGVPDRYPQNGYGKDRGYDRDVAPRGGGGGRYGGGGGSGGPSRYEGRSNSGRAAPYDRPRRGGERPSSYDRY